MNIYSVILDEIEALMKIGDELADFISIRQHTERLPSRTLEALDKWDPARFTLRRKLEGLKEAAD